MADIAARDQNNVPTLLAVSSADGVTVTKLYADSTSHRLLVSSTFTKTITPAGTTGAQVINTQSGSVNFAMSATSLVVTDSLVATTSVILATVGTNDGAMISVQAVAGNGSFTLYPSTPPLAETRVNFLVIN